MFEICGWGCGVFTETILVKFAIYFCSQADCLCVFSRVCPHVRFVCPSTARLLWACLLISPWKCLTSHNWSWFIRIRQPMTQPKDSQKSALLTSCIKLLINLPDHRQSASASMRLLIEINTRSAEMNKRVFTDSLIHTDDSCPSVNKWSTEDKNSCLPLHDEARLQCSSCKARV